MMGLSSKKWLNLSLVLLIAGSLSACNYQERRAEVRGTEETTPAGQQGATAGPNVRDLHSLQPGQPIGYYSGQFARLGYRVDNVDAANNQYMYDISKDNERYQVSLGMEPNQDRVNSVNVRSYRAVSTEQTGGKQADQEASKITQAVSHLQPGKKAYEYIPLISQHGKVTKYNLNNDRAEITFESNNRHYEAKLSVNPQTQKVSNIEVNKKVWELF